MDGSCAVLDENLDDHDDADAFEAALEPLPAWDGAAYSSSKNHAAAVRTRR